MTATPPLARTESARLEEARRLFGIETEGELNELLWRFRSILHTLEEWDQAGGTDTVKQELPGEETN